MAMSSAAPASSIPLRPTTGSKARPPMTTPTIDPSVFQPYTAPIARSPEPLHEQGPGEERQGHAGTERGRKHDHEADRIAGRGKPGVALIRSGERGE